jgi:hypothetical protein
MTRRIEEFGPAEAALLSDLGSLLQQHGVSTFKSLAAILADAQLADALAAILEALAAAGTNAGPSASRPARKRPDRLSRAAAQLDEMDESSKLALGPIVESALSGDPTFSLRDLQAFADRARLRRPAARSRRDALADVVLGLLRLSVEERSRLLPDLQDSLGSRERSLEGWDRIIERSRAQAT